MPKATDAKRTALAPLIDAGFDLIPLNGVSKEPLNKDWTNRKYNPERVTARAVKLGNNVGVRLRAAQLVIDVDPRNGGDQGFDDMCLELGLDASEWPRVVSSANTRLLEPGPFSGTERKADSSARKPWVDALARLLDTVSI